MTGKGGRSVEFELERNPINLTSRGIPKSVGNGFIPSVVGRSADMTKVLSVDLRVRVMAAVSAGSSHRHATQRFGVRASSMSRWRALACELGEPRPNPRDGDRRSGPIEVHREAVLVALGLDKDVTVNEVRAALPRKGRTFG